MVSSARSKSDWEDLEVRSADVSKERRWARDLTVILVNMWAVGRGRLWCVDYFAL